MKQLIYDALIALTIILIVGIVIPVFQIIYNHKDVAESTKIVLSAVSCGSQDKSIFKIIENVNVIIIKVKSKGMSQYLNDNGHLIDSWGNKITWINNGSKIIITSSGRDGIFGTRDDITADLTSR